MVEVLDRPLAEQYNNLTRETLDPAKVLIFEIHDPEAIDAVALYNSAVILDDEEHTLVIMRLNTVGPQEGQPDITDRYTIVSIKKGPDSFTVQHYSDVLIRKELQKLIPGLGNLEDPRSLILKNGKVMLDFAALKDKLPYPALVTASPPFHKENFSIPEIIEGIPPGKNTCPLDENTFCTARRELMATILFQL